MSGRAFPDPRRDLGDRPQVLLAYLDYFRATVAQKVAGLSQDELRSSRLASGWTPLGLVKHLVFMERRWLVWGFLGEAVAEPWGDRGAEDRWAVGPGESIEDLVGALAAGGRRTAEIVSSAELSARARHGGRFPEGEPAPTLERILLHVMQEYARHVGHLDIARELADGRVGE